jgi:2Fe-2S ferredoxin
MEGRCSTKELLSVEENEVKAKPTIPIVFQPGDRVVQASQGETLLAAALAAKIDLSHSCGGNGTCGTCRVLVLQGRDRLPPRNEIEEEMAQDRGLDTAERLSCQTVVIQGLVVQIPEG